MPAIVPALFFDSIAGVKTILALMLLSTAAFAAESTTPELGSQAPSFRLRSDDGSFVSLDQYRGKWVVLYFYPKDYTAGCTLEADNFRRDAEKYSARNAVILGVSTDSIMSHRGFSAQEQLNFKLLSDIDHVVAQAYGSTMQYNGKIFAARNTFLIDPSGKIRRVYERVNPETHSDEVLADLAALQR